MKITFRNGESREAILLSQTEDTLRVALKGAEDATTLRLIHGTWVSDECEPVQVQWCWESMPGHSDITEDDCICSPELAAKLLRMLFTPDEEHVDPAPAQVRRAWVATANCHVN